MKYSSWTRQKADVTVGVIQSNVLRAEFSNFQNDASQYFFLQYAHSKATGGEFAPLSLTRRPLMAWCGTMQNRLPGALSRQHNSFATTLCSNKKKRKEPSEKLELLARGCWAGHQSCIVPYQASWRRCVCGRSAILSVSTSH